MVSFTYLLPLVATLLGVTNGFVVPSPSVRNAPRVETTTQVNSDSSTGFDSFAGRTLTDYPSGEEQRQLRRTVYTHDDWKKHRSQDRFIVYLAAILKSGVYKNLGREVGTITAASAALVFYNALVGGYQDFEGVKHAALISSSFLPVLTLPMSAFTLTSPSLGLLLVFRTNSSYQRWDEARKNWGMNINHTRDLVRLANAYYDGRGVSAEQRADDLNHVALCTWAFVRSMKRHLSPVEEDEEAFKAELYAKLPEKQAEMILAAAHRPNRALQDLSYAIDDLPMHFIRKNEIHKAVTIFEDNLGSSERLLTSPVPLFYSRHLARYLAVWLLLLPFGVYDAFGSSWNHIAMIPAIAVISTMLAGIEEIGTQLEEPFTVLPMQAFCDKIYNWCMEIVSWTPGDNGRAMRDVEPQHAFFQSGASSAPVNGVNGVNGSVAPSYVAAAPVPEPAFVPAEPEVVEAPQVEAAPVAAVAEPAAAVAEPVAPARPVRATQLPDQSLSFEDFLKSQGRRAVRPN
jgi:predicted membrane chloride channel (bestrophin family)